MHEGSTNPRLKQELPSATDLALRAREVAAQSLGKAMSTLVVQERRLWLSLAERSDVDKVSFLDALVSQAWLFGDTVEDCAQQFSAIQKQTEAIQHILPRRDAPLRRRASPSLLVAVGALLWPPELLRPVLNRRPARRASRRSAAPPVFQLAPISSREAMKRPWHRQTRRCGKLLDLRRWRGQRHSFPRRRAGGESFILFRRWLKGQRYPHCQRKSKFPFLRVCRLTGWQCATHCLLTLARDPSCQRPRGCGWGTAGPPHAPLASPNRDSGSSARMSQNAGPSVPSSLTPIRCTTAGTSIVPLEPLVGSRTQFDSATRFSSPGDLPSSAAFSRLRWQLGTLLSCARRLLSSWQGCNRAGPSSRDEAGVLQPLFHRTQERQWFSTNPGLRLLNRALHRLPFKMLTHRRMIKCIQPRDWFAAIDLKDAYFHVSILPRHRPFLRFASEGRAWQYRVLPFGLSLSPRVFTKVAEGALAPLWEVGIRILNCLEHGPRARTVVRSQGPGASAPQPVGASGQLGKEQALPCAENLFSWCGVDLVSMTARLMEERAQSVLNCLSSFRGRTVVPLKLFQRLLGHKASAAAVTPLGLLHMRPLQHWLHARVPRWAWRRGALRVNITQECRRSFSPWTDLAFLRAGVPLEQVSRHVVVTTDASSTGWGATCNGQAASGLRTGPRLLWHINCLELLAVHLASRQFRPLLLGKHVLVRTDNTAAVSYINRMGGIRSRRMSQLARHLLLWSHTRLKSLRAVHIPGRMWHSSRREDPRRCTIGVVLSFMQERLERRLSPSTLKLYVAAIAAHHDAVDGRSLGKHDLIVRFLRGASRLNPSRPPLMPSWDLSIVLVGLQRGPFEPLDSVELKYLSAKTALLTALTSIKRVGDLQAFFSERRVPCVRAGLLSCCSETPAWIRAQGSHHALPRSGGEPASTAFGGGSPSLGVAVSRKSIAHICGPHPELQKLWAAPCLLRWSAEREGCLQAEVGPLDSGCHRLGVPIPRRAVPHGGEGSLHTECCLLPCVGARRLSGRHR